jgi:hypothetical protein
MLRHAIAPARFFTQVPNDIIRHPRLSSDAVRLLTWQLSLPEGADEALSRTAARAGIGKCAFLRAKGELKAEGYLHEWREQGVRGLWSTVQLVSNVPLTGEEAAAVRAPASAAVRAPASAAVRAPAPAGVSAPGPAGARVQAPSGVRAPGPAVVRDPAPAGGFPAVGTPTVGPSAVIQNPPFRRTPPTIRRPRPRPPPSSRLPPANSSRPWAVWTPGCACPAPSLVLRRESRPSGRAGMRSWARRREAPEISAPAW